MRLIKIGLSSIDTTVGDFEGNLARVIDVADEMSARRATVGVFQEQVIGGYPGEDLVQWEAFVEAQSRALDTFAAATNGSATTFALGLTVGVGGDLYNCAAVVCGGTIYGIVPKEKLPTYGVFYEARTFSRGVPGDYRTVRMGDGARGVDVPFGDLVFTSPFGTFGVEVCEDIWSSDGPMRRRSYAGAELILNLSASPFRGGVVQTRNELLPTRSADNQCTLVYANQFGANDSLVFDGGGYVFQNGRFHAEAERWREHVTYATVDLGRTQRMRRENTTWRTDREEFQRSGGRVGGVVDVAFAEDPNDFSFRYPAPGRGVPAGQRSFFMPSPVVGPVRTPREEYFDDLVNAAVTGMGYMLKTAAFSRIGVSNSGGKDSVLTAALARIFIERNRERFAVLAGIEAATVDALIPHVLTCISQPTEFNSDETRSLARRTSEELGATFIEEPLADAFTREVEATARMTVAPLDGLTVQNIQARIRGQRMWNWANATGGLWLQTGNMSEKAVGYTTVGGDLMGAYGLISNLPKTVVIELLRHIGKECGWPSLIEVADSEASAELAEDQNDETDLMPFPVLDACFALFAGEKMDADEVLLVLREMWTDDELREFAPSYEEGMLEAWVDKFVTLFFRNIFKWVQSPQAVHVGSLDLDRERALQIPVVQSPSWAARKGD